ncbi:MAG: polyphenol oxidase family protein, partial [Planctomycetes bacterium]|nr:polyphenol oxidase family protein [Planctomycetota bacterium]
MSGSTPEASLPATLRWQIAGVAIAYSTEGDGDLRLPTARQAWLAGQGVAQRCVLPRQVHGCRVVDAQASAAELAVADGVVSADAALALGVYGADCPALVLVAPDALGVAHCGWRGTATGIVAALVTALARISAHPPGAWRGFVGPGISGLRYEVDAPVLEARAWPAAALRPGRPGHAFLDVPEAVAADALACG